MAIGCVINCLKWGTVTMKLFKHILYLSEASVAQEPAIARAVSVVENNQADLTVIDVIPALTGPLGYCPADTPPVNYRQPW
ncbi:MAG: hypothetical protein NPIRA03_37200 [Nitrospirales bacterium]|nr:MAG: hypothetical protein NPIRA03_37200 [Nitrospirales bacterium]